MKEINTDNARKVTISLVKANIFSIVLMVASAVILIVPYCLIWGGEWRMESGEWRAESGEPFLVLSSSFLTPINGVIFLVAMLVGVVVHELIHGITWACFAPSGWKSISFGVIWKMLTPYCHCNEPMRPRPYILGALMPLKAGGRQLIADSCCLLPRCLLPAHMEHHLHRRGEWRYLDGLAAEKGTSRLHRPRPPLRGRLLCV